MRLVLLHSPLVGPGTWRALSSVLRSQGFEVAVADFAADMAADPPYYPRLVESASALLKSPSASLLVAHSGAGSLVPAVAACGWTSGAIFVDALLPHPGRSWFETVPPSLKSRLERSARDGRVPPWHLWWPDGAVRGLFGNAATYAQFSGRLSSAWRGQRGGSDTRRKTGLAGAEALVAPPCSDDQS